MVQMASRFHAGQQTVKGDLKNAALHLDRSVRRFQPAAHVAVALGERVL